jgi:Cthe_2314-like HEPN
MSVYDDIAAMITRASSGKPATTTQRIKLYGYGLSAKLRQAEYAMSRLSLLTGAGSSSTTSTSEYTPEDQLHFYVDSFFAFLYSVFDVLGQVTNQTAGLGLDEEDVSFNKVKGKLANATGAVPAHFIRISKTHKFKNLARYRNCSTHRRRIYVETTTVQGTPGYSTGPIGVVKHVLADDPLALKPKVKQKREVVEYCTKSLQWARDEISKVVNDL